MSHRPAPVPSAGAPRPRIVTLNAHDVRWLPAPARVRAERGTLWITVDGEPEDIVLAPGESRRFGRGQRVLAWALGGEASFEVCAPARAARPGLAAARARLVRLVHRLRGALPAARAGA